MDKYLETVDSSSSPKCNKPSKNEAFEHDMTLYLADAYGFEVPNTDIKIKLIVIKETIKLATKYGETEVVKVTLQLPGINFETGPYANDLYETNNPLIEPQLVDTPSVYIPAPQQGGYLYTKKGFLPEELRPNEVLTRAFFGPSNNGNNLPFHYVVNQNPPPTVSSITYTPPLSGFQIRITNSGGLVIEGTGTFANIIPPGTQQLLATNLPPYIVKPVLKLKENTQISTGVINVTQYGLPPNPPNPPSNTPPSPAYSAAGNYVRDHHVNDAFDNVVAFAWADNSNIVNPASNPSTMHLAYAIGKVKDGKLKMNKAKFLPTPVNFFVWDTAIAINRKDSKNIVISYDLLDFNSPADGLPLTQIYAAVSFDGGETWPINGPTNIQPIGNTGNSFPGYPAVQGGAGDCPGVRADKFGNFWYVATNFFDTAGNETNVPFAMVSSDMGKTWTLVYTFPDTAFYDYPSMCFGGDGFGNYGLHINADYFPGIDSYPAKAFIPITGLGQYNVAGIQQVFLTGFLNNIFTASISASEDGRLWTYGSSAGLSPAEYTFPGGFTNNRIVYKSPGPLDQNYAGPWGVIRYNSLSDSIYYPVWKAAPFYGFFQSVQTSLYDEKRKALYVILNTTYPELSQNSNIYFLASGNNGSSFSNPLLLNSTDKNNRGFPSMALDKKTGNVVIGWYDCRDSIDGLSFFYYGAVIPSDTLDRITSEIPHSNPVYTIPPGGYDVVPNPDSLKPDQKSGIKGGKDENKVPANEAVKQKLQARNLRLRRGGRRFISKP